MNFPLADLEQHLADHYLTPGGRLLQNEQVRNFEEVERHLWTGTVAGREIEIQISPSRVRAVTCDCGHYAEAAMCEHLAAGLLTLRRKKQQEATAREAKKRQRKTPATLNTKAVLDQVAPEELEQFVRDYARSNREFNLLLRARFAKDVPLRDGADAYAQLLDAAISDVRRRDGTIRYKGVVKLVRILRELMGQAEEHLERHNHGEAHRLLAAFLQKVGPTLDYARRNAERLEPYLRDATTHYRTLALRPLPVELADRVFDYALATVLRPYVRRWNLLPTWLDGLAHLATTPDRRQRLLGQLDELMHDHRPQRVRLLGLKMDLLHALDRADEARAIAERFRHEPDLIARAALRDVETGNAERALGLLAESFRQTPEHANLPLQRAQSRAFLALHRHEEARAQAWVVFLRTLSVDQPDDYALLRATVSDPERWQTVLTELLETLQRRRDPNARRALEAIFVRERMIGPLIELLRGSERPSTLNEYGALLFEYDPAGALRLYREVTERYQQSHFGKHAKDELATVRRFLASLGRDL